jgi:arginine utilization protein RocB
MFAGSASAQNYGPPASAAAERHHAGKADAAAPAQDAVLKACEQAVDELKLRRAEVGAFTAQLAERAEQLKLYEQLVSRERERGDLYKQAAEARAGANQSDERRDELRRQQLAMYAEEVARLREENASLRRSRDRRGLLALVGGIATGVAVAR